MGVGGVGSFPRTQEGSSPLFGQGSAAEVQDQLVQGVWLLLLHFFLFLLLLPSFLEGGVRLGGGASRAPSCLPCSPAGLDFFLFPHILRGRPPPANSAQARRCRSCPSTRGATSGGVQRTVWPQPHPLLPAHPQAGPSSLKGHLSCGPQNCGLQSGSMPPCSSPRTCYMPGACKGRCGMTLGPSPLHAPSDLLASASPNHSSRPPRVGTPSSRLLSHPFSTAPQAPLLPGGLTWAGCTGGSCGNRRQLPSGAAWTRACATRPSWTCKGARSGGRTICHVPKTLALPGENCPSVPGSKLRPDSRGRRNTLAPPTVKVLTWALLPDLAPLADPGALPAQGPAH